MARRTITPSEIAQVLALRHAGLSLSAIERAVGMDRKTIRKYVSCAEASRPVVGVEEMSRKAVALLAMAARGRATRKPGKCAKRLARMHAQLEAWAGDPDLSVREMHRRLAEIDPAHGVSYTALREYLQRHFTRPRSGRSPERRFVPAEL